MHLARELAVLHRRWEGQALDRWPWLRRVGAAADLVASLFEEVWPRLRRRSDLTPEAASRGERAIGRVEELAAAGAAAGPCTLCHGDVSFNNVFTAPDGEIAFTDWEDVGWAPGVPIWHGSWSTSRDPLSNASSGWGEARSYRKPSAWATSTQFLVLGGQAFLRKPRDRRAHAFVSSWVSQCGAAGMSAHEVSQGNEPPLWQYGAMGRLSRWLLKLWKPLPFQPNGTCPLCSTPVVLSPTTYMGSLYSGPIMARRTRDEQIAACPTHGRSPFNDLSVKALNDRQ